MDFISGSIVVVIILAVLFFIGLLIMFSKFYRKVEQGQALIKNGLGGTKVSFSGMVIVPIIHRFEMMDITVKRIMIDRAGEEGLICKDNMRADIKVAFFIRVNKTTEDVERVAQSIGCDRASNREALQGLFEAKFSEALKTVGKQFNFVDLYNSREQFKDEILKIIGTDLNGYVMDDAAIDFLEQTPIEKLNPDNILDSEGIKKITNLTSEQKILANQIDRNREKTITKQNVEAKEAVLELERQREEAEAKQKREVESVKAREEAETQKVQREEHLKAETARISAEEEIHVATENKDRQIIVARKNKERTEAIEVERVEKDRMMEATERERIVELAQIEKEKAVEEEKKNIQNVIRERVAVEKTVVEEQERIKDTQAFAGANREKKVAITQAEKVAEEALVVDVKGAEASKTAAELKAQEDLYKTVKEAEATRQAAELNAEEIVITADAKLSAAEKDANAKKLLAEGTKAEKAAPGLAEVQVAQANYELIEPKGTAEANVTQVKYEAEATGVEKTGVAEAKVMALKFQSEAKGIETKAHAMKLLDAVGRDHEEFKLRLNKEKDIELAAINIRKDIAANQAEIMAQALKSAKVDIVGGDTAFFDRIVHAITGGKAVDRFVDNSKVLTDVKQTFFNDDPEYFRSQLKRFFTQFGVSAEDVKDLTVSAALSKLITLAEDSDSKGSLYELMSAAERSGMGQNRLKAIRAVPSDDQE